MFVPYDAVLDWLVVILGTVPESKEGAASSVVEVSVPIVPGARVASSLATVKCRSAPARAASRP